MDIELDLVKCKEIKYNKEINFEGVIGQRDVIKKIKFFIEAHKSGFIIPTFLFTGSHGVGKTYIAEKISNNLNRRLIVINAKTIENSEGLIEKLFINLVLGEEPVTILIDEAHYLSKEVTALLLTLLNPNKDNINKIRYKNLIICYDMRFINIIFATTDAHDIFEPLRNRCENIYFCTYSDEDIIEILKYYLKGISISCDIKELAQSCRNRARDAFVISKNIERYCSINNCKEIGNKEWNDIKGIFDIQPMGLTKMELKLLKHINDFGPISCLNLASVLMVNEENIKDELEIRLRELNFIENTTRGRILTKTGKKYMENIKC